MPATFNFSGRQNETTWASLIFVNLNKTTITDQGSFVPTDLQSSFPKYSLYKKIDRNSAGAGLGLAGVYVYANFQAALLLTVGGSLEQKSFFDLNDSMTADSSGSTSVNAFVNLGYNGKKHQLGLSLFNNAFETKIEKESLNQASQDIRIFYGYRFDGVNLGAGINWVSSLLD